MLNEFSRLEILIGDNSMKKLKNSHVAIFGLGGVGSFTAEALIRSGVGTLTFIDDDIISITNLNRQIHATHKTIGESKVEIMKNRALSINPNIKIITFHRFYNRDSNDEILEEKYDYIIDAIDTVTYKLLLIEECKKRDIPIISSMGTGNKLNPTMLEINNISETSVCPLARLMRRKLKKMGIEKVKVIYSKEDPIKPSSLEIDHKAARPIPGSTSFVPSVAGLIIASEVVKDIINKKNDE